MNNLFKTAVILCASVLAVPAVQAQIAPLKARDEVIDPYHLFITYYKTTNLVFPYAIKSVDRGSLDILAQKAKNTDNVLQVKAGRTAFDQTNLTVITADGKLYSYVLDYVDTPTILNVSFDDHSRWNRRAFFSEHAINEAQVTEEARKAATAGPTVRRLGDKAGGMSFRLDGIYVSGELMYLRFGITNRSDIDYDISQLRMSIRDQKKVRRTATQELEIEPVLTLNAADRITGNSERELVYAVPKFTIPDKKYLAIQLMEVNGGRTMELSVHNKTVVKAKLIQ
jgi:conjugative transposon TraN protein